MQYYQHQDDEYEWVDMRRFPFHKISCCDCGLVHTLEFKKTKTGLLFRAKRDNRATGQKRRQTRYEAKIT